MLSPLADTPPPELAADIDPKRSWQTIVLAGFTVLWGLLLAWSLVAQHRAFNSNGWDLGWFDQIVWNTAHGRPFENSFAPWGFLGEHIEPVLFLFAAAYRVKADVEILLVTQAIVSAGAAVPLYFAARSLLKSAGAALLVAMAFLIAPQFNKAVLFDFHPEVMGVASVFACFACLVARRPGWALVAIGTAFLLKEDATLVAAGMAWVFWLYGYRRHAVGLLAVSLVYFVLATNVIMPHARDGLSGGPQARWSYLGDTGSEIVMNAALHPDRVVKHLALPGPRDAALALVANQAFLPLLTPAVFSIVPVTAAHLLSSHEAEMQLQLHYGALPIALAFVSTTMGIAWLARAPISEAIWRRLRLRKQHRAVALAGVLFAVQLAGAVVSGPFGMKFDLSHYTRADSHSAAVKEVLALVPPRASVAAQSGLVPHLSQRRQVWEFPPAFGAQYVVVDLVSWYESHGPYSPELDYNLALAGLPGAGYCLITERDQVQLWRLCGQAPGPAPGGPPVDAKSVERDDLP